MKEEEEGLPEADWKAENDAVEMQSEEGDDHSDECDGPDDDVLAQDERLMGPSVTRLDDAEEDGTPMPGEHFRRFVAKEGTGRWTTAANMVNSLYKVSKEKIQDVFKEMVSAHSSGIKSEEKDDAGVHKDAVSPGPFDENPNTDDAFLYHYDPAVDIIMPEAVCRRLGPSRTSESGENYREAGCESDVHTLESLKRDMWWQFGMNTPFLRPGSNRKAYREPYTPE